MSKDSEKSKQEQLDALLKVYLDNIYSFSTQGELEFEVRFGTRGVKPITRIDYDNVIQKLLSSGFEITGGKYLLRINNEFVDVKTGSTKMSNIRTQIFGLAEIGAYCKTNTIDNATYIQKQYFRKDDTTSYPVNFDDFNFRASLQGEKDWQSSSGLIRSTLSKWADSKKTFRYINRYSLKHPDLPINVEVSIVKDSNKRGRFMIPTYNIRDSGVFSGQEKYEVEIETINQMVGVGSSFSTSKLLGDALKKVIKLVLSGLQGTNYPISYIEQANVSQDYMKLIWGDEYKEERRIYPKNFIGPSSYTLQVQNIAPINDDAVIPNIRKGYTVTDKADGDRKLLYISGKGKIYLINTNMKVQFTGAITNNSDLFNSLFDGEHILHDKNKKFINLYAAFDVYYINGKDMRTLGFIPKDQKDIQSDFRLPSLVLAIKALKPVSIVKGGLTPIRITNKAFYSESPSQSIFQGCGLILQKVKDGLFEYETDGLIFTPASMGVGSDRIGTASKPFKTTWTHSFKWKPVEFNTIDFLITIKKTASGGDYIGNIFQNGIDTSLATQLTQYKTAILRVGFDEKKHGYINPCQNIIDDDLPSVGNLDESGDYRPMQFFPTNPTDVNAGVCNILLRDGASGDKSMFSEENEVIEDNMIVEFRYDIDKDSQWRWVPLRVRYDKTAEYRSGLKNYGNAYHVANSNWHTIHNPITHGMISTGEGIPDELGDDDVYYNRVSGATQTQGLRDFHNLFVKKLLVTSVSKRGDTLIDLAVGKGGDISKWIAAKLKFVLGIDIKRDNIENRLDGVCARYLNYRKKFRVMPDALFINGNSSVNIKDTANAIYSDKGKQITRAVFGKGAKDEKELGKGVYKQYGVASEGFDICSIQFAIHYMFESQISLQNFLRNVSETTKIGGYFIGTSYDGAAIFKMLAGKKQGESVTIMEDGKKMWEVTKQYDRDEFPNNSSSIGYGIDVYQESINKTFKEYLVNYDYLTRLLENYGFVLLTREEAMNNKLPSSTGFFNDLYGVMTDEIKRNRRVANEYGSAPRMTANEKKISFLNRYFVYKKVRNVDAEKVAVNLLGTSLDEELDAEDESKKAQETVLNVMASTVVKPTKKKKLKLKLKE